LRMVRPPVNLAPLIEAMYWNPRNTDDPAHISLRARLIDQAACVWKLRRKDRLDPTERASERGLWRGRERRPPWLGHADRRKSTSPRPSRPI